MKKKKVDLSDYSLNLYNNLSLVCGIFSIVLTPTGVFGVVIGFLGICLSVTYYTATKKIRFGYILSIVGSILSAVFLVMMLCLIYKTR